MVGCVWRNKLHRSAWEWKSGNFGICTVHGKWNHGFYTSACAGVSDYTSVLLVHWPVPETKTVGRKKPIYLNGNKSSMRKCIHFRYQLKLYSPPILPHDEITLEAWAIWKHYHRLGFTISWKTQTGWAAYYYSFRTPCFIRQQYVHHKLAKWTCK